jgi:hypothetical protein
VDSGGTIKQKLFPPSLSFYQPSCTAKKKLPKIPTFDKKMNKSKSITSQAYIKLIIRQEIIWFHIVHTTASVCLFQQ